LGDLIGEVNDPEKTRANEKAKVTLRINAVQLRTQLATVYSDCA